MSATIQSGQAMVKVLESWGVDHIYGLPGGSINSIVGALYERRSHIRLIQVRHEETGALAASADAKLTGKIGVCFGSAGPGATHLFNGLYDAKMDHVPVLALIGQVASDAMNYDSFQELNENPMFADVSIYNRTVMTPESLPHVVDEAVRRAYEYKGVAVVTVPMDFAHADIPDVPVSTAANHRVAVPMPDAEDVAAAVELMEKAQRPVLYVGQGAKGAAEEIMALSDHYAMPVVLSVLAKGIIPDSYPNFLGMAARVATKPANEALAMADLIVFIGSDFPFARAFFSPSARFIQVDIDSSKLGRRHHTDVAVLGDAREAMRQMLQKGKRTESTRWLKANRLNREGWDVWLKGFKDSSAVPMRVEPVFHEINRIAKADAIFVTDVGNSTIHAVRLLDMNAKGQQFTTSGWFATMGYGVPGGIAAKLSFPHRQVFTLNGDGAFSMSMQDILTQVRYQLPVINIVFSNDSLGFIEAEQEDSKQDYYGIDLTSADFAKAAEAMGAIGYTVTRCDQLKEVFDEACRADRPVVIDVKVENKRPFPAESFVLDGEKYSKAEIDAFKARYEVRNMPVLRELMA